MSLFKDLLTSFIECRVFTLTNRLGNAFQNFL
ncbi:Uncharacterised protein [Vibrio cholerae]|nr:Uncharacterised protein [Vibrio cholerae]